MTTYAPPLRDMSFVLHELLGTGDALKGCPTHKDVDESLIDSVLDEAGKFALKELSRLNAAGDSEGCRFDGGTGSVETPPGFRDAYGKFVAAGWPSLACSPEYGGQGLPATVNGCVYEMMNSANMAWTMYPGLSHGAYECITAHGTEAQKSIYLPKLVSGEWTGTMCLTEPHCGTDLGLLRTRAEKTASGGYRLTGTKIFISAGEHDMSSNIVHLVLARVDGAPVGTRGISLFIVPKFIPDAEGKPGQRNGIACSGMEEKMGIHGNATCQMSLDGAEGSIIGDEGRGLAAMFVMMNAARLGVATQALGLCEIASQNADIYAAERVQMRAPRGVVRPDLPADPIASHPDVRRMLLTARAWTEGGRALTCFLYLQADLESSHHDPAARKAAGEIVALLTPVAKAFMTENCQAATSEAMQVFGGHGYVRENGMEQFVRDARITTIYEGTTTVQALDLLGRKVLGDAGAKFMAFGSRVEGFLDRTEGEDGMGEFTAPLRKLAERLAELSMSVGMAAARDPEVVGAAATPYLRLVGHLVYAWQFAEAARVCLMNAERADPFYKRKMATIRFYFARLLPETETLFVQAGASPDSLSLGQ